MAVLAPCLGHGDGVKGAGAKSGAPAGEAVFWEGGDEWRRQSEAEAV